MKSLPLLLLFLVIFQIGWPQKVTESNFKPHFDKYGVDGCLVLYNQAGNEFIRYNSNLCDSGYIPASTFKIPHTLITLNEGIVKDTNQVIQWDGHEWPNKPWNQNQTLRTAMKYSCVWVYTGFAEKIPIDKYYSYVTSFDYGNKNLAGPPTRFWLTGSFRVSANQQIDFLRKFYNYTLPISKQYIDMVKDIIVLEKTNSFTWSGKTGGGMVNDDTYIMWLVGYVVKNNTPYFYALNFKTNDFDKTKQARYEIAKGILKELKLVE